jgi:hypothetical protein
MGKSTSKKFFIILFGYLKNFVLIFVTFCRAFAWIIFWGNFLGRKIFYPELSETRARGLKSHFKNSFSIANFVSMNAKIPQKYSSNYSKQSATNRYVYS